MQVPFALWLIAASLASSTNLMAQIRWTGMAGQDVFNDDNWDLSLSTVAAVEPGVPIDDNVIIQGSGVTAQIPSLTGQGRLELMGGRTLTLDGARLVATSDDGIGGTGGGIDVLVRGGASLESYFVAGGVRIDIDGSSAVTLGGPGNPLNGSTANLAQGSELRFTMESPAAFAAEHLPKISVEGLPALIGQNLSVTDDGPSGCIVRAVRIPLTDQDDDLLSDTDEQTRYFTDPTNADTDGDGCPDGFEVALGLDPLDPTVRADRPNVVFILVDDLGWGDLGVLHQNALSGPRRLRTPHLDRMAAEGVRMMRHYCPASVCAPSRASLLTGVHQGHATVRNNQFDKALEANHNLATTLKRAGYATAHIGKYGLQGRGSSAASWPAYPTKVGFDTFYGYVRHGDGHNHYPFHDTPARPSKQVWWDNQEVSQDLEGCYTSDLWTARAKAYLLDQVQSAPSQPFFLYLSYDTPHAALQRPTQAYPAGSGLTGGVQWTGVPGAMINTASAAIDSFVHPDFRGQGWTEGEERFATIVRRLDQGIGDLLDTLVDLGIDQDTLVVLTSDNGPHAESYVPGVGYEANSFDSFGPFDGVKRCSWEGGVRVPTLAWWPGTIPAGRIDETHSQFHDWMTTLTELGGWTTPARSDGVSLLPALTGNGEQEAGVVYVEYESGSNTPSYPEFDASHRGRRRGQSQVIFEGGYKGIRVDIQSASDPFEIYDVEADPRETNNLAQSSAAFVALGARMQERVLQLRRPEASAPRPYDSAPVPAAPPARIRPGLDYTAHEGVWPWVPQFSSVPIEASGVAFQIDAPVQLTRPAHAGLLYEGYLSVPAAGEWTFTVESDGGAILRIHDIRAVDGDTSYLNAAGGGSASGTLHLAAGLHPVRLSYRTREDAPSLVCRWSGPGTPEAPIPSDAWRRVDRSIGDAYCEGQPNSTGKPARLYIEGSPVLSVGSVTLRAECAPPATFGFFLTGQTAGFVPSPGGSQGNLCMGGTVGRFLGPGQILAADAGGGFSLPVDVSRIPTPTGTTAAMSFETWHFQAWYRDTNPTATSNFTEASRVTFF